MRNYSLDKNEKQEINGKTVYRIVSNKRIKKQWDDLVSRNPKSDIRAGEKLGWLENEENIDFDGNCCVLGTIVDHAAIKGPSFIDEESTICGYSLVDGKSTVINSTIENANINNSKIIGSEITGNKHLKISSVKISGQTRIIDSTIKNNVKISGKANISDSCINGNVEINGDIFMRRGASFDMNSTNGWPNIKGNIRINGKITICGSVDISDDISIMDKAVIIGDVLISGKGTIAGDAEIGLSEKLPDGKIKIKAPSILNKNDFGAKTEITESGSIGVFCYRKNNKIHGIEYVVMFNGNEIARSNNIKDIVKKVFERKRIEKKYGYLLDIINKTDIDKLLKENDDYSEMRIHANVVLSIVRLFITSKGNQEEFSENLRNFLGSCRIDINSNKITKLENLNF